MWEMPPPPGPDDGVPIPDLPDDAAAAAMSDLELVSDIWAADARESRYAAERAASIAALARRRSVERDREFGRLGGPGLDSRLRQSPVLADVSETFVTELAMIRSCSEREAEQLAIESILLTTKLTATWSALYAGRIDVRKMRAILDLLGPAKPKVTAAIEARVLPGAERLTVPQLRDRIRRALARMDAAALDKRRRDAARRAGVWRQMTGDGMCQLVVDLSVGGAAACHDAISQYADLLRADGDLRPIGVIRAAVAQDLILRPWDTSRPSITAQLVIHAPLPALSSADAGSQPPAEVAGEIVTAAECRELLEQLDMLGVRAAPAGGCVQVAIGDPVTGRLVAVATRNELRRGAFGGRRRARRRGRRPAESSTPAPRPMPTGAESSGRSDHPGPAWSTGAKASRRTDHPDHDRLPPADGPGLRPPPPTSAYRPSAAQERFVEIRDRRCRMPGCRRRAGRCDIDHAVAHAEGGPTACWNLCCLCRRHHRIKTFARGWHVELLADGRLLVRAPSGVSRITRPPGWTWDPEPDPPWLDEEALPDPLAC